MFPTGRQTDQTTLAQAFAVPGIDPRVWISYGVVDEAGAGEDEQAIEFDRDDGQVYANVLLKPYDTPIRCRVGQLFAGPGEACFFPLVPGDEVLVAIPEGHFRAGAVIIARLNNAYDAFPFDSVAGADPTKNSFAVFRTRTALTIESGASVMVRSAAAGAFLLLSGQGNVTLRDSAKNVLQMSPDVFGFQNGDGDVVLQLDMNAKRFNLAIGNAQLTLSGDGSGSNPQSVLQVPSTFAVTAAGQSIITAVEHVLTTEAFCNLLAQIMNTLGLLMLTLPNPVTPNALSALFVDPAFATSCIAPGASVAAHSSLNAAVAAALFGAFTGASLKPPGVPGQGQLMPGIGCAGFLAG
jgi:hypothetical protein